MSGVLDYLSKVGQPRAPGDPQTASPWQNRIGLFGATLKDVGANLGGRSQDAQNIDAFRAGQKQETARGAADAARIALQQALAGGDHAKLVQAALAYSAAGGDLNQFIAAAQIGQPTISNVGADQNVYSTDMMGNRTLIQSGIPKPPPGYTAGANGSLHFMPGGPGDPSVVGALSDARDAAHARHRAPRAGATVVTGLPSYGTPHL